MGTDLKGFTALKSHHSPDERGAQMFPTPTHWNADSEEDLQALLRTAAQRTETPS